MFPVIGLRLFEVLSMAATLALIGLLMLAPAWRRAVLCVLIALAALLAIQIGYEGPHWQLLPLYAATLAASLTAIFGRGWPIWLRRAAGAACLPAIAATAFASWISPMFALPQPTGSYAVGTRILALVDSGRAEEFGPSPSGKRELMAQVWYPAEKPAMGRLANYQRRKEVTLKASYRSVLKTHSWQDAAVREGQYPVLIYNPGWLGERTEGTYQAEELASHGFIVVAVDHTFFGGLVEFPDGRVTDARNAPDLGNFDHASVAEEWELGGKYVRAEALDDIFVLNHLQAANEDSGSPWFHRLDFSRVGAFGFSIGGAVAIQCAIQDVRVKAALDLDGWVFGDFAEKGLKKPMMIIYEDKSGVLPTPAQLASKDTSERKRWEFSVEDFGHVLGSLKQNGGYLLYVAGTRHADFTDRTLFSPVASMTGRGTLAPERVHFIANTYTLAFFTRVFGGNEDSLLDAGASPFPEVTAQRFPGEAARVASR